MGLKMGGKRGKKGDTSRKRDASPFSPIFQSCGNDMRLSSDSGLRVQIGRITMQNPVMVASGTFGYADGYSGLVNPGRIGAIVTKTITLKPRAGNPMPRTAETPSGMLNSIGLQNEGVDDFVRNKMPPLRKLGVPVIVSIGGDSVEEYPEVALRLGSIRGISGIEINISCPNIRHKSGRLLTGSPRLIAQDEEATYQVVRSVRKVSGLTLITKLSPNVTDIVSIARSACRADTDAISLVNTFIGMAVDIQTRRPKLASLTGGLSGPCIKPIALRMVHEVAANVDLPVIGMGGILTYEDALEFIMAGATAVAIGTGNFVNPQTPLEVVRGIKVYMKRNRIRNIMNLVGSLD
jgi:dihydroorotate dehydrogenase (NAD+) catalytic subunit